MRRLNFRPAAVSTSIVVATFAFSFAAKSSADEPSKPEPNVSSEAPNDVRGKQQTRIKVSPATTRIVEPLNNEGFVDYLAALNQRTSEGVTSDNNAAVYLVRALGLEMDGAMRDEYFRMLGIEPLPEAGGYLTDPFVVMAAQRGQDATPQEYDQFLQAASHPWSAADFPVFADWLKANETPVELIVKATQCPHCYFPLIKPESTRSIIGVLLPTVQASRSAGRVLLIRAMLRLSEGKVKEAQSDILAVHRLARLVGNTPFVISALVGFALEAMACEADAALISDGKLSAADALNYQAELRKLVPFKSMADQIDVSERFVVLDVIASIVRDGAPALDELSLGGDSGIATALKGLVLNPLLVDWNETLKLNNQQFDKMVSAAKKSTAAERIRAFHNLEQELMVFRAEVTDPARIAGSFFDGLSPRQTMGRQIGKVIAALICPAVSQCNIAETRMRVRAGLDQLGFALAAYHADNGKYPETLDALIPKYIAEVPADAFADQPFQYKPNADGFLLYSMGDNMFDDEGRTFDSQPQGDDIRIEVPRGPLVKPQ